MNNEYYFDTTTKMRYRKGTARSLRMANTMTPYYEASSELLIGLTMQPIIENNAEKQNILY